MGHGNVSLSTGLRATACLLLGFGLMSASAHAAESGYRIAFTSFAPFDIELFVADGDGSNARPFLSDPGLDFDASYSNDGKWVVFASTRAGQADIYRAHPDGSALEKIVDDPAYDGQAALSPNGRTLAFVSSRAGQADVWLMDMRSRKVRNLTQNAGGDFRPAWSPDGKWLAFSTDRDSKIPRYPRNDFVIRQSTELYVVNPDGSGLRRITHDDEFAGSPAFSSDGRSLVFYTAPLVEVFNLTSVRRLGGTTQIESVNLETGQRRVLTTGAGEKFSPRWLTADRIGYSAANATGGIEFASPTGGATTPGARGVFRHASWTRDGKHMVFQRDTEEVWPPNRAWPSLDERFPLLRVGVFASYSPAGDRRVSNDKTAANFNNSILMMNADGSQSHAIYSAEGKNAMGPAWSHQGDRIAFALGKFYQNINGPQIADIAAIDPDGSHFTELTDGKGNYAMPSWSGDGKHLVYRRSGASGNALEIVDVDTHAQRVLTTGPHHYSQPGWSPVSDVIQFTADIDDDYEIYTIRADGSDLRRLTNSRWHDAHATWSPDGQWIVFTTGRGGFKDETPLRQGNPQSYGEICVMRADGSEQTVLTDNPFEDGTPTWIPDIK
jgi:TolB protein